MDLLKLKLIRTDNVVGVYRSYNVEGGLGGIEGVLVKTDGDYPDTLDIMILGESIFGATEQTMCVAKFLDMGSNKISMIRAVREATGWGLKESKDWVESIPHTVTPKDGFSRSVLQKMVRGANAAGGRAEMQIGNHCDNCELRFRCYTER